MWFGLSFMCYLLFLEFILYYILTYILLANYMLALIETALNSVVQCYSDKDPIPFYLLSVAFSMTAI